MNTQNKLVTIKPNFQMLEKYSPVFVRDTGPNYFGDVILNDELVLRAVFAEKTGNELDTIGFNINQLNFVYNNYRDLLPADSDFLNVDGTLYELGFLMGRDHMKHLFLNYRNELGGFFSVNPYPKAGCVQCVHNDIADFLQDAHNEVNSCVGFEKSFAIRLLENCYYWQGSYITNDTLEIVYRLIKSYDYE